MISCKRAAELISKSMDGPLSIPEEVSLKIHLFICEMCEQFRHHLKSIRSGLTKLSDADEGNLDEDKAPNESCPPLCDEAKERIKKKCGL